MVDKANVESKSKSGFMTKAYRILKWSAILLAILLVSFFALKTYQWVSGVGGGGKEEISSTVMLERVQEVTKVITVEGYFSEIFDYKDYNVLDFMPFRKKALVRVKAKVSVGTDLTKAKIVADEDTKTIHISNIPPPEILSIDHDLDYYDLDEGIFNAFDTKDYNKINALAKDFLRQRAEESDLLTMADSRLDEYLRFLESIVVSGGWQVLIDRPKLKN